MVEMPPMLVARVMRTLFVACFLFALFVPAAAVAQAWKPTYRAVASAYCGADEGGKRLFVPYIEHDIRAIHAYSNFQSADCKAAMGAVCGLLHPGELTLWRDLKCEGWPMGKRWVEQLSPAPLTEDEWRTLPGPFALEKLKEDLIFLNDLAYRVLVENREYWLLAAVGAIAAVALVASVETFGGSLAGAVVAIVAILGVYYDQFTPDEKRQFDRIRAMTASVDPRETGIEIDEIQQTLLVDGIELTVVPEAEESATEDDEGRI